MTAAATNRETLARTGYLCVRQVFAAGDISEVVDALDWLIGSFESLPERHGRRLDEQLPDAKHRRICEINNARVLDRGLRNTAEILRKWVRQAERDEGMQPTLTTDEQQRLKDLEREVRVLERANGILRKRSPNRSPPPDPPSP